MLGTKASLDARRILFAMRNAELDRIFRDWLGSSLYFFFFFGETSQIWVVCSWPLGLLLSELGHTHSSNILSDTHLIILPLVSQWNLSSFQPLKNPWSLSVIISFLQFEAAYCFMFERKPLFHPEDGSCIMAG